ncbi:MAG: PAS domain-containing sensor histidine kinase [Bacteroidota bacterium]
MELLEEIASLKKQLTQAQEQQSHPQPYDQDLLPLFVKHSPHAVAMFDIKMRYLLASQRWIEDYRLHSQDIIGKSHYEIFPEIGENWKEDHRQVLQGATIKREIDTFPRKDGSLQYLRYELRPWRKRNGEIGGLFMFTEVITDQVLARIELEKSQKRYKRLIQSIPGAAVMTFDKDFRFSFASGQGLEEAGFDPIVMVGKTVREVLPEEALLNLLPFYEATLAGETRVLELPGKDGRAYQAHFVPILDENDEVVEGMVLSLDVTELNQARLELQKALEQKVDERNKTLRHINREAQEFAYTISHDLRVPLVNIQGFTGELAYGIQELSSILLSEEHVELSASNPKLKELLEEDIPESLQFIESSTGRMEGLIKGILQVSRLGQRKFINEEINTKALLNDVLDSMMHIIEQKQITLSIGDLPNVEADPLALEQIFSNLLSNAVKYLLPERSGYIEIGGEREYGLTRFYVKDNGRGIATLNQKRIFYMFSRLVSEKTPGEGMGLAFVRTLVRKFGGTIECDSQVGIGSTFTFTIVDNWLTIAMEQHPDF